MLNVAFDAAGLRRQGTFPHPPGTLGRLIYVGCVDADLIGLSVNEVLERANRAIAGQGLPPGVSFSDLVDALTRVNEGFVDCRGNGGGCFRLP
jgi:hypothetical protein